MFLKRFNGKGFDFQNKQWKDNNRSKQPKTVYQNIVYVIHNFSFFLIKNKIK